MQNKRIAFFISLIILLLSGCLEDAYEEISAKRAKLAERAQNTHKPIVIGISWSENSPSFLQGVKLAVEQINAEGGVLNRPLKLIINTEETRLSDPSLSEREYQDIVTNIAESFAHNLDMIAVMGHGDSKAALLASTTYQNNGLLFFAPTASNLSLTNHQFAYLFRTGPNNNEMGVNIADYIAEQGYKKVALIYDRGDYATELTNTFSGYASEKHKIKIVFSRSFFKSSVNITSLIIDLKKADDFDLVFIVSTPEFVEKIYQESRNMGLRTPFVGGETLATHAFLAKVMEWENAKELKKSIIPTIFNPLLEKNQAFIKLYDQAYHDEKHWPEQNAALGYDNIMLLAHAIKRAQSTIPMKIANTLRYMQPCQGIAGIYQFTEEGDLVSKPFYFRSLDQGRYVFNQQSRDKEKTYDDVETCNKIDQDQDSIPNNLDACPDNTAEEISKGVVKTGLQRGCSIDTDKDKVADYHDLCPKNSGQEISKGVDEQGCPLDSDGDKTPDYQDACPNNPELTEFISGKNCVEDRDNDGITDDIDQCPDNSKEEIVKGVNKKGQKQGCPVDTDLDKLVDYLDKCPSNTFKEISQGVDETGCPADNDHDGILDYLDKCPKTPPNVEIDEQGCGITETTLLVQNADLYFKSGKIILTAKGKTYLKALVSEINPSMLKQIKITVHTDDRGTPDKNQALSDDRAETIANYLIEQGIDCEKISAKGKGASVPLTDNKTAKARKQNRRLAFILKQFKNKTSSTTAVE